MNFQEYLHQFNNVLQNTVITDGLEEVEINIGFEGIVQRIESIKANNKTIFLVGNGGSSGIVSHSMVDFINACKMRANAITDNSLLTCMANDYGYENVYKQPLATLISEGDVLIAVSSSGNSQNIIRAAQLAKENGAHVITLSGFKAENPLRKEGHYNLWLESASYGFVEIGHALLLHYITDTISSNLPR